MPPFKEEGCIASHMPVCWYVGRPRAYLTDNWIMLEPTVLKFGRKVGHDQTMTPLYFEIILSKVKVKVTLNRKTCLIDKCRMLRPNLFMTRL